MKLGNDVPTQHEQKKKKRVMIATLSVVGVFAVVSIVLLAMTIGKIRKEAEKGNTVDVTVDRLAERIPSGGDHRLRFGAGQPGVNGFPCQDAAVCA